MNAPVDLTTYGGDVPVPADLSHPLHQHPAQPECIVQRDGAFNPLAFYTVWGDLQALKKETVSLKAEIQKCQQMIALLTAKGN